jgi:diguanylate cyclase (GGDEF)-like protein
LNRYSLESRLAQSLLVSRRESQRLAVLFIDMDRFKSINDTLGHHMGDQLLKEVARRLQSVVRESDIVARQGGDEFVVVLTGLMEAHDVASVVNKLLRALGDPYSIEGHTLRSSPSIGVAMYPEDGGDVQTLLKNADTAMYHAKDLGRNNAQYFSTAMTKMANERMMMESDLCVALADQQFELYYQPQVRALDRRICGVEALLRWHHPQQGMVSPERFIPVAEEAGLIHTIGAWVLDEACRQLAAWRAEGIADLRMAVNLSAHQLRSPELVRHVSECMARHGILPDQLELEITESTSMENPERAIGQLQALRDLGLSLAIDDFGTGYSSLAYLKHLPIQMLKLDRSFVRDIETDVNDAAISAATIALAHNLGLTVVAEGVENEVQANYLCSQHDCDFLQGYLYGRPEPADTVTDLLRRRPASADFLGI